MKNYFKGKMTFHFKEYQLSIDSNKEKAANHHLNEYLYYKQMFESDREFTDEEN